MGNNFMDHASLGFSYREETWEIFKLQNTGMACLGVLKRFFRTSSVTLQGLLGYALDPLNGYLLHEYDSEVARSLPPQCVLQCRDLWGSRCSVRAQ